MSQLYLPWGSGERYTNRMQVRNQFASTLELHKQSSYEYQEPGQRQRSPSLPPIHHSDQDRTTKEDRRSNVLNRNIPSAERFAFYDEDGEGDTSGYGSETINHKNRNNELQDVTNNRTPVMAWEGDGKHDRHRATEDAWSARSPRCSTAEEGRPRWGDRGVATGRLWEPTAPNERLPQMTNQKKGTPSWVERGLNMIENAAEVLVIDQRSSTNSGFDCDRSSCNGSDESRTFLRGQNVPLEPEIKAQRENRRMKALELQSAILNQLEDRKTVFRTKEIRDIKKALEDAERMARQEKEKRFQRLNANSSAFIDSSRIATEETESTETLDVAESVSPTKTNRTYDIHSAKSQKKECDSHHTTEFNSPRSSGPSNLNLFIHSVPPLALADNQFNIVPIGVNSNGELLSAQPNSLQLAVLVPQNLSNSYCSVSLNSLNNVPSDLSDSGKVLTPRKYRLSNIIIKTKEATTQTDTSHWKSAKDKVVETEMVERNIDKDYPNIDENAPQESTHNTLKKDRRFRSEERYKKDIESRPKWGVNRPAAQYKKQSEKDPFYSQKRKLRQKYRTQARQYLSHSSEDSRSPSPPIRTDKSLDNSVNKRNSLSQSYWKNKRSTSQDIPKSTINESPSNIALEFTHIGHTATDLSENRKSPKRSPSKRITLSQKFINDKYGNRKLWLDDVNERNIIDNRKKIIDQLNLAKKDYLDRNDDHDIIIKAKF
ncbi:hypothetical protein ACJJTC_014611 [Scirpophaga incertulas]